MNINVIPGYDLERIGSPGFGPLLAVPNNLASHRDPSIRQSFEKNLVGGRYQGASQLVDSPGDFMGLLSQTVYSAVLPAVIARPLQMMQLEPFNSGAARNKAAVDVLKYLAMNDKLPDEKNMSAVELEKFMDEVDLMALQLQILQALSWGLGPATGTLADLVTHENWEWNEMFQEIIDKGVPYEEAYRIWMENIEAFTGEPFNPLEHSPFRVGRNEKVPYAVLEGHQSANEFIASYPEFMGTFKYTSGFFLDRKFDVEDTEYVAETKQRQINLGLSYVREAEDYLEELYSNSAASTYHKNRQDYLVKRYTMKNRGMDTSSLDMGWTIWKESFDRTHPVFAEHLAQQNDRRERTITEMRMLVSSPELIPDATHKEDILMAMSVIVDFDNQLKNLRGRNSRTATDSRNRLKFIYKGEMEKFVNGKPWLNELYYSVFLPMVGDSWLAKFDAGLIEISLDSVRV